MRLMPNERVRVKSQSGQLCLFAWADAQFATPVLIDPLDPQERQAFRLSRKKGVSIYHARAWVEANGGAHV